MATAHVYARVQVTGTYDQVQAIVAAANALQEAVEATGADWKGSATAEFTPDEVPPEVEPPAEGATTDVP